MGFWDIALKEYGDAKFQDLIAAANPKADPTKLRPGQKLILPPAATQVPAVTRKGGDVYVVQEGDAGFWGIAQKKYGHGKYWTRIQRANPGVDAYNLRAGQQLIIPPLSQSSAAAPAPTVSATTPPGARKVYTVQAGDAGFWGVAKKVYGDGKYHEVIASANPDADSAKLKPGQKLIIPPLTLLDRRQSQRASSGSGGVSDKPTFE
jgi:nucleoid-associated protein YgaU